MKVLFNDCVDVYSNMALDTYCLESLPLERGETLVYLWRNCPSVIIGVTQNPYTEVNLEYLKDNGISLARRVTGGGAVYHDLQNLNYSFVKYLDPAWDATTAEGTHPAPVLTIASALRSLGVNAQVGGRNDIFVDGLKVSGYARRVYKNRELIHGTLMWDVDIDTLTCVLDTPESKLHRKGVASVRSRVGNLRDLLPQFNCVEAFRDALLQIIAGPSPSVLSLTAEDQAAIEVLACQKFRNPTWLYGRWD